MALKDIICTKNTTYTWVFMFDILSQTQKSPPFIVISTKDFLFLNRSASFDAGSFVVTAEWQELHHLMNIHNKLMFITFFMSMLFNPSSAHTLRITMNS